MRRAIVFLTLILATAPALAYIGPGAGISFLGSIFTWVAGALIALLAILLWPLRAVFRRMRRRPAAEGSDAADSGEDFSTDDYSTKD